MNNQKTARPAQKLNPKKSPVGGSLNQPRKINCFYNSQFFPCAFTAQESQLMEKHYRQKHYPKAKEVFRG